MSRTRHTDIRHTVSRHTVSRRTITRRAVTRRTVIATLVTVPLLGTVAATAIEYGLVSQRATPVAMAHIDGIQGTGHASPNGIEGTG